MGDTTTGGNDLAQANELLRLEVEELRDKLKEVARDRDRLADLLAKLKQHVFGRRSERLVDHPQLPFEDEEQEPPQPPHVEEAPDEETEWVQRKKRKRRGNRLPSDLPRKREVIEPPQEEKTCASCGKEKKQIGEEITEELEYQPASFYIREIVRPKYVCPDHEEEGVATAELPPRPIPRGLPGAGLIAQVLTAKYRDHLPLHRQHGIYLRHGVDICETTMVDWVRGGATVLLPVVEVMRRSVLSSYAIHTDDTTITVQDRNHKGGSRKGYIWVYIGDQGDVVFDYTPGRSRDGPKRFLGDYQGYLQADGYAGYDELYASGRVVEVGCWSHARRKFVDALPNFPAEAGSIVAAIRKLFMVERQAAGLDPDARRVLRQRETKPLLDDLKPYLLGLRDMLQILPEGPLGQAITYSLNQWNALTRFLDDGRLAAHNNDSERALRQVVVGRKNWLFAGSEEGARRAATIYSVIGSCTRLELDPFEYLRDVLVRLPAGEDPETLTPRAWKAARDAQQG